MLCGPMTRYVDQSYVHWTNQHLADVLWINKMLCVPVTAWLMFCEPVIRSVDQSYVLWTNQRLVDVLQTNNTFCRPISAWLSFSGSVRGYVYQSEPG